MTQTCGANFLNLRTARPRFLIPAIVTLRAAEKRLLINIGLPYDVKTKTGLVVPASVHRQAGIKTGDNEYTLAQQRIIEARLAKALRETKAGNTHGPFNTVDEMATFLKHQSKKVQTNPKCHSR